MKVLERVRNQGGRPGQVRRAGVLLALFSLAVLPGCFFDRSGIAVDSYIYDCSATIQAADGTRSTISTADLMGFDSAGGSPIFIGGEAEDSESFGADWARTQWLRYLRRVLEERSSDAAFTAVYGAGPWCVVGQADVARTGEQVEATDPRIDRSFSVEPLDPCVCEERCGNPPGIEPLLEVSPTSAGRPTHVEFGPVPVGGSTSLEVTLSNAGEGRLCLTAPAIHGSSAHPDDFVLTPIAGCGTTPDGALVLEGPATCRFTATFAPTQAGPRSARVPATRGCGDFITLSGTGEAGRLEAGPAPACFAPPLAPGACRELPVRIDNTSSATVSLSSASLGGTSTTGWELLRLQDAAGTEVELPFTLAPGSFAVQRVRACEAATGESLLRVMHNGADYGAPGSPTGDVDAGSPLVVRLQPPTSGCTP